MTENGPTSTPGASFAPGATMALGWIATLCVLRLHGAEDVRFRDDLAIDARRAGEFADAAHEAVEGDLDLEDIAGHHRLLEARVVDADVVVDRVCVGLRSLGEE